MQRNFCNSEWFLFEISTDTLLDFLESRTGRRIRTQPGYQSNPQKWQRAIRRVLERRLHLDLGIPGIYTPESPLIENKAVLHAALLLGLPSLQVILSGEWELAVREGLISKRQLWRHKRLLQRFLLDEAG